MYKLLPPFCITILLFAVQPAQAFLDEDKKICQAVRVNPKPPVVDGSLDDEIWEKGEWSGNFTQHEPYNGNEPSQKSYFKIQYDSDYLYAAFKMSDSEPDKVVSRITRRDDADGDRVTLCIDSYFDQRTAFLFTTNAAGVKSDEVMTENGDKEDMNWDPIWWAKAVKTPDGWTAEMKIPLNQLRFANSSDMKWGIQVMRYIYRNQETDLWQHVPKDAPGFVHLFGELHGLNGLAPKRQVEVAPYMVTKTERLEAESGNPFMTGKNSGFNAGVDAKIGITNNFTLDLTVNPDFGQVEADPAVVNLSAFETYFEEKRPFFIEGSGMMNFPLMFGDGDLASQNLFYSRRIGRAPQLQPDLDDNEYAKIPSNTAILGAAKVTGRTGKGMSVGVLETITNSTYATIDSMGFRTHEIVEPLTNYTVASVRQEFSGGNTIISGIATSTNRQLNDLSSAYFHQNAFTGGMDLQRFWSNKKYLFCGKLYFSHVNGSKEAIAKTQTSPARYFQRPDNSYTKLDSTRTSLTGTGGLLQFGKVGEGHLQYMGAVTWHSPQLEINDIGYIQNVDDIFQVMWVGLRFWKPTLWFRYVNFNLNQWATWNFGGQSTDKGGNINFNLQFTNYWTFNAGINGNSESLSAQALRGGPMLKIPGNWNAWYNVGTDGRKKLIFYMGGSTLESNENYAYYQSVYATFSYRPLKNLQLSLNPSYSVNSDKLEFVENVDYGNETRYIQGKLSQKTFALSLRMEFSINPDLSVQYYGRPYLSSGKYTEFKRITNPMASSFDQRFETFEPSQLVYNQDEEEYYVDENNDGTSDYSFSNRNFNFMDLQSNLIVRWEYRPGSTLFLVWTLGKQAYESEYGSSLNNNIETLYDAHPHNIFLLKFSYRFN